MRFSALLSVLFLSVALAPADEVRSALGVTRQGMSIDALLVPESLAPAAAKPRVLLIGGLDGRAESVAAVTATLQALRADAKIGPRVAVSAVPNARPDASALAPSFPPAGEAYLKPETDAAHYLWRGI